MKKQTLIATLRAYNVHYDSKWTVQQLMCRLVRNPNPNIEGTCVINRSKNAPWLSTVAWHAANVKDFVTQKRGTKAEGKESEAPALWAKLSATCRLYAELGILLPAEMKVWRPYSRKRKLTSREVWRFATDLVDRK